MRAGGGGGQYAARLQCLLRGWGDGTDGPLAVGGVYLSSVYYIPMTCVCVLDAYVL